MKSELTDIAKEDVEAVVLACTELELVVNVEANVLPIYDSTIIHAEAGTRFCSGRLSAAQLAANKGFIRSMQPVGVTGNRGEKT